MSDEMSISILGIDIPISGDRIDIQKLRYSKDNPRVYSALYGENSKIDQNKDIQEEIYKVMLKQPSVKNIKQDIQDSGLHDEILIRHDTMEVVEGNSRLTVYKFLNIKEPYNEKWQKIRCKVVSKLTDEQQDSYLNRVHIKGKTDWSPYEKANFIYRRYKDGVSIPDLMNRFAGTENEIRKRIKTIEMMVGNDDHKQDNFSYYNDIMVRTSNVAQEMENNPKFKSLLLRKVKDGSIGKALPLRNKLKKIVDNPRQLKRFCDEKNTLDEAYGAVETSNPDAKLNAAKDKMKSVTMNEIERLKSPDVSKLEYTLKNINKEYGRIKDMIEQCKQ